MARRIFLSLSAVGLGSISTSKQSALLPSIKTGKRSSDIIVIGAGVFGVWTAFYLYELGAKVMLRNAEKINLQIHRRIINSSFFFLH